MEDLGSVPALGQSPGAGNGYPLQDSGQENSMDCIWGPWGRKESDMTERLSLSRSLTSEPHGSRSPEVNIGRKRQCKIPGSNPTKGGGETYTQKSMTLIKELKKTQRDGNIFCVHGFEELI